jgi:hypothetical protein
MSRTEEELLQEALIHFDTAVEYKRVGHPSKRLLMDAVTMRLFAGLETLTRLRTRRPGDSSKVSGRTCEHCAIGSPMAMEPSTS